MLNGLYNSRGRGFLFGCVLLSTVCHINTASASTKATQKEFTLARSADYAVDAFYNEAARAATLVSAGFNAGKPHVSTINIANGQPLATYEFSQTQVQGFDIATLVHPQSKQMQQQLVFIDAEGLVAGEQGKLRRLASCSHLFQAPNAESFERLPVTVDVNSDGLSDFFLPGLSDHCLFVQKRDGNFATFTLKQSLTLSISQNDFEASHVQFTLPDPLQLFDIDGDGLQDIVMTAGQILVYFRQTSVNDWETIAKPIELPVQLAGLEKRVSSFSQLTRYQLHKVADLNNDALMDVVLFQRKYGKDISDADHSIRILYGERLPNNAKLSFDSLQGVIPYEGELAKLGFADFNGDGRQDVYMLGGDIGAGSLMSVMMSGGIDMDINIYPQRSDGRFSKRPKTSFSTEFAFDVSSISFGVLVHAGNFNGDEFDDLLYVDGSNKLILQTGDSQRYFARKPTKVSVELPKNPQYASVTDTNNDGVLEVVLRYPKANGQWLIKLFTLR